MTLITIVVPPSDGGPSRIGPSGADGPQAEGSTSSGSEPGILTPDSSDTESEADPVLSMLAHFDSSSDSDRNLSVGSDSIMPRRGYHNQKYHGHKYTMRTVHLLDYPGEDDDNDDTEVHPHGVSRYWDLSSDEGQVTDCRDVFPYALSDATIVGEYGDSLLELMASSSSSVGRESVHPREYQEKADKDTPDVMKSVSKWVAEAEAHRNKWHVAV